MPHDTPNLVVLRGAPGSGKSSTAKYLSRYFPSGVRLEVDFIRQMVISVDWKNQQEHINILQVSTGLALGFLNHGFSPVIVIDTFSGDKIKRFLDTLSRSDSTLSIRLFGLFTNDEELKRRLGLRPDDEFKDFPISKKLNDDMLRLKQDNEIQIDTTGLSPEQAADRIYGYLET